MTTPISPSNVAAVSATGKAQAAAALIASSSSSSTVTSKAVSPTAAAGGTVAAAAVKTETVPVKVAPPASTAAAATAGNPRTPLGSWLSSQQDGDSDWRVMLGNIKPYVPKYAAPSDAPAAIPETAPTAAVVGGGEAKSKPAGSASLTVDSDSDWDLDEDSSGAVTGSGTNAESVSGSADETGSATGTGTGTGSASVRSRSGTDATDHGSVGIGASPMLGPQDDSSVPQGNHPAVTAALASLAAVKAAIAAQSAVKSESSPTITTAPAIVVLAPSTLDLQGSESKEAQRSRTNSNSGAVNAAGTAAGHNSASASMSLPASGSTQSIRSGSASNGGSKDGTLKEPLQQSDLAAAFSAAQSGSLEERLMERLHQRKASVMRSRRQTWRGSSITSLAGSTANPSEALTPGGLVGSPSTLSIMSGVSGTVNLAPPKTGATNATPSPFHSRRSTVMSQTLRPDAFRNRTGSAILTHPLRVLPVNVSTPQATPAGPASSLQGSAAPSPAPSTAASSLDLGADSQAQTRQFAALSADTADSVNLSGSATPVVYADRRRTTLLRQRALDSELAAAAIANAAAPSPKDSDGKMQAWPDRSPNASPRNRKGGANADSEQKVCPSNASRVIRSHQSIIHSCLLCLFVKVKAVAAVSGRPGGSVKPPQGEIDHAFFEKKYNSPKNADNTTAGPATTTKADKPKRSFPKARISPSGSQSSLVRFLWPIAFIDSVLIACVSDMMLVSPERRR